MLSLYFVGVFLVLSSTTHQAIASNWLMLGAIQPNGLRASLINETIMSMAKPSARGYLHYQMNQLDDALNSWLEATKLVPSNPIYSFWQGIVFGRLGDNERAVAAWRQANTAKYWAWLSAESAQKGAGASAYELAERSILINSTDKKSRFILGEMYFRNKDWLHAIESLSIALETSHQDAQYYSALMLRGQAYIEMPSNLDKAYNDFMIASQLRPTDPWPHIRLCQVYGLMGRTNDAVFACKQATSLAEDSAFAHYYLGWAFFLDGQYAAAAAEFEHSLELDPNLQAAQDWLAKTQDQK
jgi:tetratricopeptide (TPR) repeat protein